MLRSFWMATDDGRRAKACPEITVMSRGAKNLEVICEDAWNMGIKYLTVYLFSTENWKRSKEEVDGLMRLFRSYTKTCIKTAQKNNMKVRVLGDPTALDPDLQESLKKLEESSKDNTGLNFQIAINYGSRDEITRAVRHLAADVKDGKLAVDAIDEACISGYLDTQRSAGSGPSDPHQRRAAPFQLPALAAGLYGILFYRCALARFYQGGALERPSRSSTAVTGVTAE